MGNDAQKQQQQQNTAGRTYLSQYTQGLLPNAFKPTPLDTTAAANAGSMMDNYNAAVTQNKADYTGIMGNYANEYSDASQHAPPTFNFSHVSAERPAELNTAYSTLESATPGYTDFANTGGYSDSDIANLRARGVSPIRAAYGNTMDELNRAKALGGAGGSPNYIAAVSSANRQLPQQMADATQGVNAQLAEDIRSGKLAGLSGLTSVGSALGGLSSAEAARILQADTTNSQGDLQAAGMTEDAYSNELKNRMGILGAAGQLYGTTPGMTSVFGSQALNAQGQALSAQEANNNFGLGLIGANQNALNGQSQALQSNSQTPWWKSALSTVSPLLKYLPFGHNSSTPPAPAGNGYGGIVDNSSSSLADPYGTGWDSQINPYVYNSPDSTPNNPPNSPFTNSWWRPAPAQGVNPWNIGGA